MKDKSTSSRSKGRIWVSILQTEDDSELENVLNLYQKEAQSYDNTAVIVGPTLSFEACARLEDTFDFVVKLGNNTPDQINLLLWEEVTIRIPSKKNGIIPHHLTNGHAQKIPKSVSIQNEAIAIVGLSCRLPGANDSSSFWSNLLQSKDSIGPVPSGRWRSDQGCRTLTPEHLNTRAGFLDCPVDTFDSGFWGISPLELGYTDPQARLLLQLGWEALEDAGIPPTTLHGSDASIFLGLWRDEYKDLLLQSGSTAGGEELRRYLGCSMGNAAARLAHALKTTGPAYATETGCSSSICSIGSAMSALREGKTSLALAGGANLLLKPFVYPDFQGVLSPSGRCRVFQEDANGFARAEGAIFFVLKRYSDAIADGDTIHALLRGYGSSQEGLSKSVGTPTVQGEARAMTAALDDAGLHPSAIDWVEMHGTGTKVGDPIEIASTRKAYSVEDRDQPLILSSVKANIGHTESVSGAAGLLKVILAMKNGCIPPQLLTAPLNPKLQLDGVQIPKEVLPWTGQLAGVSSFGITGTNAHLIVERCPTSPLLQGDKVSPTLSAYILPLSAKCPGALKDLKLAHAQALKNVEDSELGDYCYTASSCREHFSQFRSAVVASNREEMIESLLSGNTLEREPSDSSGNISETPELCFLFPGQGCQYTGMGRGLYEACAIFRRHFDIVDSLLNSKYGINLKTLLFEGTAVSLYSQLCIFGVEYSLLKMWSGWGVSPSLVLGHSFGEFAASVAAGALSLPTALELLVAMRTKLFSRVEAGGMLVLKADEATTLKAIEDFCAGEEDSSWVDIAGLNSSEQTVVSTTPETISKFSIFCKNAGIKNTTVGVTHAFHSRALDPIGEQFEVEAGTLSYSPRFPNISYISSVEGRLMEKDELMTAPYWRRHMRQRVEFMSASQSAVTVGGRLFLEVGPHPLLSPLVSKNAPPGSDVVCIPSMRKGTGGSGVELGNVLEAVGNLYANGVNLDWDRVWNSLGKFIKVPRTVPGYPFQNLEAFWFTPESEEDVNSIAEQGTVIHPLLGRKLATPLQSTYLFVSSTSGMLARGGEWLNDHKLGNHVIFPGAGYVEMVLAAVASIRPVAKELGVILEKFDIKAALPLETKAEVQTVVQEEEGNTFKVGFHSRKGDSGPWKLLCVTMIRLLGKEDEIIPTKELNHDKTEDVTNLYNDMQKLGYNFGPTFRTLEKLQKCEQGGLTCDINPRKEVGYFLHPTVIDALVQAALLSEASSSPQLSTLKLPTSIASFIIRPQFNNNQKQLRLFATESGATLLSLDDTSVWREVASLKALTTVSTSLTIFERAAGLVEEPKCLPFYAEEWTPTEPLVTLRETTDIGVDLDIDLSTIISNNVLPFTLGPDGAEELEKVEAFVCEGIVATFHQLGWDWGPGVVVNEEQIEAKLGISTNPKFLRRLLHYGERAEWLRRVGETEWKVLCHFGTLDVNQNEEEYNQPGSLLETEWSFASFYVSKLGGLLTGCESVLPYLFPPPQNNQDYSAERLYSSFSQNTGLLDNLTRVFDVVTTALSGRELRILEVGGGTGSATRKLLHLLEGRSGDTKTSYTFSDLSPSFLTRAENTFPVIPGVKIDFQVLDLEKDPLSQGFAPGSYDAIVALNVLHATVNVEHVCGNIRSLLRPRGVLLLAEQLNPTAIVDIIFGHCEGYWRFDDEARKDHCLLPKEGWASLLSSAGYESSHCVESEDIGMGVVVATNTDSITNHPLLLFNWVLLVEQGSSFGDELGAFLTQNAEGQGLCIDLKNDLSQQDFTFVDGAKIIFCVPESDQTMEIDTQKFRPILASFLDLSQILVKKALKNATLFVISHGVAPIKDEVPSFPLAHPILGLSRTLANECSGLEVRWVDLDLEPSSLGDGVSQIVAELRNQETKKSERFVSYRSGIRHVAKLCKIKTPNTLPVPEGRVQLRLPESRSIADVEWEKASEKKTLGSNEIEVRVLASGLNFKDLLNIMKPTPEFRHASGVGADFCGEVISLGSSVTRWSLGDSVLGMNPFPAPLPNHVTLDSDLVAGLPPAYTHVEGATTPTAFLTAYHCLVEVGGLSSGEWVLIHTASGAVGLAAIQVAKAVGAEVVVTAGSRRKRAYLRSLGLTHVHNSRDLSFAAGVMEATSGTGVDLVLNSLTSKGWKEASLSVLGINGRFVEMSKLNIWSVDQVTSLRPDVSYSVQDLGIPDLVRARRLTGVMDEWLRTGQLVPLKHTTFEPSGIAAALGHLERALHIGKVVVRWSPSLFNERSTYLITGGLGALGLELARWILSSGGKHLVLVSRAGRTIEEKEAVVKKLKHDVGFEVDTSRVIIKEADVGDKNQVAQLLSEIVSSSDLPPVRGIFHTAGVLSDGTLPTQSMAKMETVLSGKVDGAWFLHSLAESLSLPLEHFVLFSSAMWLIGGPGQGNYAAANASLSSLAEYRHRLGLPATAIAWGHWGEVGMAAVTGRRIFGMEPFSTERGLASLEQILRHNGGNTKSEIMAAELSEDIRHGWLGDYAKMGEEKSGKNEAGDVQNGGGSIEDRVRGVVGKILRVKNAVLEGRRELRALGMDSLMFIELKNRLTSTLGVVLEIPDTATVDELVSMVTKEKGL